MPKPYDETRERIRSLFPGDGDKGLRHHLYSKVGFLESNPTQEQIIEEAEFFRGKSVPPDPAPTSEADPLEQVRQEVSLYQGESGIVTIQTPQDYEEASIKFATIKRLIADNEKKRKQLTKPILEAKSRIDDEFKAAEEILKKQLDRYEQPMLAFKLAERETLRKQEAERLELIRKEQEKARLELEEAQAKLAQAEVEDDPFLAALAGEDIPTAREEVKDAMRNLAMVPQRVVLPDPIAPVTATGSRTSYPWVVRVTNAALVAREYCSPDTALLGALAKHLKATVGDIAALDITAYPGLEITEEIRIGGR